MISPILIRSYYHYVAVYELGLVSNIRHYKHTGLITGLNKDGNRKRYYNVKYRVTPKWNTKYRRRGHTMEWVGSERTPGRVTCTVLNESEYVSTPLTGWVKLLGGNNA